MPLTLSEMRMSQIAKRANRVPQHLRRRSRSVPTAAGPRGTEVGSQRFLLVLACPLFGRRC
jgi:hypothetical protein